MALNFDSFGFLSNVLVNFDRNHLKNVSQGSTCALVCFSFWSCFLMWFSFPGWRCMLMLHQKMWRSSWKQREEKLTLSGEPDHFTFVLGVVLLCRNVRQRNWPIFLDLCLQFTALCWPFFKVFFSNALKVWIYVQFITSKGHFQHKMRCFLF